MVHSEHFLWNKFFDPTSPLRSSIISHVKIMHFSATYVALFAEIQNPRNSQCYAIFKIFVAVSQYFGSHNPTKAKKIWLNDSFRHVVIRGFSENLKVLSCIGLQNENSQNWTVFQIFSYFFHIFLTDDSMSVRKTHIFQKKPKISKFRRQKIHEFFKFLQIGVKFDH